MLILDGCGLLSMVVQAYGQSILCLYGGRFMIGVYLGLTGGILPIYLISITPPEYAGITGTFNQLLITIGIASASGLGMV